MLFGIRCAASESAGPRVMWDQRSGSGHDKVELVLAGKSGVMRSHLLYSVGANMVGRNMGVGSRSMFDIYRPVFKGKKSCYDSRDKLQGE